MSLVTREVFDQRMDRLEGLLTTRIDKVDEKHDTLSTRVTVLEVELKPPTSTGKKIGWVSVAGTALLVTYEFVKGFFASQHLTSIK